MKPTIYHSFHFQQPFTTASTSNIHFNTTVPSRQLCLSQSKTARPPGWTISRVVTNSTMVFYSIKFYCQRLILRIGGILVSGVRAKEISQLECQTAERRAEQCCDRLLRLALVVRPDSYLFFRVWWFLGLYAGRSALWMGKQHS